MGDRAFARARAAGKNETEAGHACAKAGADIALSISAEYRDKKNDTRGECAMHSAQPAAERRWSNRRTYNIHPRRPRLVIAVRCLLYEIWGVMT